MGGIATLCHDARESLDPPGPAHLFGTDFLGRDILSRVLWGGRVSLPVGLISVSIASRSSKVVSVTSAWPRKVIMRPNTVWRVRSRLSRIDFALANI